MDADIILFSHDKNQDKWLHRCLPTEPWQEGYEEVKAIIEKAKTGVEVVDMILNSDTLKGTQIYAELSKISKDHYDRIKRDFGGWIRTYSDAGSLKIGHDGFTVHVPNGYGDGSMLFTVVEKGCCNRHMLDFWTDISGHEIDIYDYDCTGGKVIETIDGWFGIYYWNGFVVFERWGDAQ
jgi:hypothetical protein